MNIFYYTRTFSQKQGFNMGHMSSDVKTSEISWKTVFNSNVADHYIWTCIDDALTAAKKCGYEFFSWNGRIYSVNGDELPFTTDDLDGKSNVD
jgi:hypothetical protein